MYFKLNSVFLVLAIQTIVGALYDFPEKNKNLSIKDKEILNKLTDDDLRRYVGEGTDSVLKQLRLEENLVNSDITVQNGSLSHGQLLETLPNRKAKEGSIIATKILRSSLAIFNSVCADHGISGSSCRDYLSEVSLPENTSLWAECSAILSDAREGHNGLRRLLPNNYQDGFYKMHVEGKLPAARLVSSSILHGQAANVVTGNEALDEERRNLVMVQWTQFLEHDISKPVATSMKSGESIDCCNSENYKLQPRYLHPACAPLIGKESSDPYGRETCLNYVRSALAVHSKCNFGGAEQLNQATGYLDLSQLYGHTQATQDLMRTHRLGLIKSSQSSQSFAQDMLPLATTMPHAYCALKSDAQKETCFMAGDSRVNSNPYSIALYTVFMRSHNQIAAQLHRKHPDWNDDHLYEVAKAINIAIYRRIVYQEWLPTALGQKVAAKINAETPTGHTPLSTLRVSNEFAVAAMRFYFSMMPNVVYDLDVPSSTPISNNDISPSPSLFSMNNEMYKPGMLTNYGTLNNLLESLMHQRAMKMDSSYAESLLQNYVGASNSTRSDILAFDIQRGRDHGLQGYVKYLEQCQGITVRSWEDLKRNIDVNVIEKLKTAYRDWKRIDLVVGGISEKPFEGSAVGPTFTCILGEQFSKTHQWHQLLDRHSQVDESDMKAYLNWTGAQLLCANSQIAKLPKNIFEISSEINPMMECQSGLFGFDASRNV